MTGKVHVLFDNLPGSIEFVKTGKLRALAVTSTKRNAALPDVPTVADTVPGYEASVFYGVAGPKGIPPEIVDILNKAFNAALADPKIKERIAELGGVPTPMTPAEFGKLLADETEKWGKVVKAANISVEMIRKVETGVRLREARHKSSFWLDASAGEGRSGQDHAQANPRDKRSGRAAVTARPAEGSRHVCWRDLRLVRTAFPPAAQ